MLLLRPEVQCICWGCRCNADWTDVRVELLWLFRTWTSRRALNVVHEVVVVHASLAATNLNCWRTGAICASTGCGLTSQMFLVLYSNPLADGQWYAERIVAVFVLRDSGGTASAYHLRFFVFLPNVSVSISFERNHFRFYIISVSTNTIVSVSISVDVGSIISVSEIVSVTEISLVVMWMNDCYHHRVWSRCLCHTAVVMWEEQNSHHSLADPARPALTQSRC